MSKNEWFYTDYDSYYQMTGGTFLDFIRWKQEMETLKLEDFSNRLDVKLKKAESSNILEFEIEESKTEESFELILFLLISMLEFLTRRFGIFIPTESYLTNSLEERILKLFEFYESVGISRESAVEMAENHLKKQKDDSSPKKKI